MKPVKDDVFMLSRLHKSELSKHVMLNLLCAQGIYKQFDKDHSGAFNSYELRKALKAAGRYINTCRYDLSVMSTQSSR